MISEYEKHITVLQEMWENNAGSLTPMMVADYMQEQGMLAIPIEPPVIKTEADTVNTVSANQRAKRWAMMNFDKWNEVTGFVDPHISYYDEITALIEDAVEFGYGVALKQPLKEIMKVIKKSEGSL